MSVSDSKTRPAAISSALQLEVILDDAVVDDGKGLLGVGVGVGVDIGRRPVGRPSRVPDAEGAVGGGGLEHFGQPIELAGRLAHFDLPVVGHRHARRVVSPVFETLEALQDDRAGRTGSDVSHDSAHI